MDALTALAFVMNAGIMSKEKARTLYIAFLLFEEGYYVMGTGLLKMLGFTIEVLPSGEGFVINGIPLEAGEIQFPIKENWFFFRH